jgi:hypothetical protein
MLRLTSTGRRRGLRLAAAAIPLATSLALLLAGESGRATAAGAAPTGTPAPYPAAWIEEGRKANAPRTGEPGCVHLVYKRGCSEVRRGRVVVGVTLDRTSGKVTLAKVVSSTIRTDPKPMLRCITEGLGRWTFKAPGDHAPTFEMTLIYSDRC